MGQRRNKLHLFTKVTWKIYFCSASAFLHSSSTTLAMGDDFRSILQGGGHVASITAPGSGFLLVIGRNIIVATTRIVFTFERNHATSFHKMCVAKTKPCFVFPVKMKACSCLSLMNGFCFPWEKLKTRIRCWRNFPRDGTTSRARKSRRASWNERGSAMSGDARHLTAMDW